MRRRAFVMLNRMMNVVVRRLGLRRFRGGDLLYLTTIGRKSGKERTTPLLYLRDGERWVAVASNGGADWEPGWWLNLQAGSSGVIDVKGERIEVTGTELHGEEREQLWQQLVDQVFDYGTYQRSVSRQLAVVALTRV